MKQQLWLKNRPSEQTGMVREASSTTHNEVLLFPDEESQKARVEKFRNGRGRKVVNAWSVSTNTLESKFNSYLRGTRKKIDVCIFKLTSRSVAVILMDLHRTGIQVRVVTDANEDEDPKSQMDHLRSAGIVIKSNSRPSDTAYRSCMHHKFAIVDNDTLMMGSLNWTVTAITKNYESVIVTSNRLMVKPFIEHFNKLWRDFQPHKDRTKQEREESRINSIKAYNSNVVHSINLTCQ